MSVEKSVEKSVEQLTDQNVTELATLLIPVEDKSLILPNVSVAEIFDFSEPKKEEDVPTWYLGRLLWRSTEVPLVSYEAVNEQPFVSKVDNAKIVIINGVSNVDELPFWGIVTQGLPRLLRVMGQEIAEEENASCGPAELMAVYINGELAFIPNLDFIEKLLLELKKG